MKRDKGYQVAVPKLATMATWGTKRREGSPSVRASERKRGRDGTLERGQIVSSRGDGKISAEIPLNAYLLHFKRARHVRQISILLKAPKKRENTAEDSRNSFRD